MLIIYVSEKRDFPDNIGSAHLFIPQTVAEYWVLLGTALDIRSPKARGKQDKLTEGSSINPLQALFSLMSLWLYILPHNPLPQLVGLDQIWAEHLTQEKTMSATGLWRGGHPNCEQTGSLVIRWIYLISSAEKKFYGEKESEPVDNRTT